MAVKTNKTVVFFGASGGVGLAALKRSLETGHECIALCRTPSKLTDNISLAANPNLRIVQGNAHSVEDVANCLQLHNGRLVDMVISTIGAKLDMRTMGMDDPEVCQKGVATLLAAITQLRSNGYTGSPHIVVTSTTGISTFGRDLPLAMVPLYSTMKGPHKDKIGMEKLLVASGEAYTILRPSLLVNASKKKPVRVGIEDPQTGPEFQAIGYAITREAAGTWVADHLVGGSTHMYLRKAASITY